MMEHSLLPFDNEIEIETKVDEIWTHEQKNHEVLREVNGSREALFKILLKHILYVRLDTEVAFSRHLREEHENTSSKQFAKGWENLPQPVKTIIIKAFPWAIAIGTSIYAAITAGIGG